MVSSYFLSLASNEQQRTTTNKDATRLARSPSVLVADSSPSPPFPDLLFGFFFYFQRRWISLHRTWRISQRGGF